MSYQFRKKKCFSLKDDKPDEFKIYNVNSTRIMDLAKNITSGKKDSIERTAFNCLKEQLICNKVLLFKEPLEALKKCTNSKCFDDVQFDLDLAYDEILIQTKVCLVASKINIERYNQFVELIELVNGLFINNVEKLIKKLRIEPSGQDHDTLNKIQSIVDLMENENKTNDAFTDIDNKAIIDFAKFLTTE